MKITFTIILTLLQILTFGQPNEWDTESIKKNKVKEIRVVVSVPKTNPEHPFMLWRKASFDNDGRLIESNCKHCLYQSHRPEASSADLIRKYTYNNDRVIRIDEMGFEESTVVFQYDTLGKKRLKITSDNKGERTSVAIDYFDDAGRIILVWEIEFAGAYSFGDSIAQVFFDKTEWTYKNSEIFEQTYNTEELVNLGSQIRKSDFAVFQTSFDIHELERILMKIDLSFLKPWSKVRIVKTRKKVFQHNMDSKTGTTFFLDKTGLILREEKEIANMMKTFIYQYDYYN